ncbi:hypothetical protein GSY74_09110 [Sulfurovum sp. bin170]|uniref:hypothetical protein n=1 Tax=Sulfurovum sp. bin170 TaxID=2695268 RepID=UPI0013E00A54|nr:hypothetical protein [Sulfurovum sp. bin170]NEW61439.1 hypothetical protein [Sulfurovum sp. bin170]
MINIKKVAHQIKFDGMYNTIYIEVQDELNNQNPTVGEIEELLYNNDEYYIWEYKNLNRYGELSSVHAKKLEPKEDDKPEIKSFKESLNENIQKLKNLENFEVDSKNSAYSIWIGSVGVMVIFMAHNIVALFSDLYNTHGTLVYISFAIISGFTYWGYRKMKQNHENQHLKYTDLHQKTRAMIKEGFEKGYITHDELFEAFEASEDEFFRDTTKHD